EVEAYTSGRNSSAGTKITRFTVASMLSAEKPITKEFVESTGVPLFDPYRAADLTVLKATLDSARIVNDMAKDALGEREGQYSQDLYEAFAKLLAQAEVYVANPGDLTQREADVFNNQLMASLSALVSSRIPFNVVLGDKTAIRIAGTEKYLVQKNKSNGGFWYAAFMSMDEIIKAVGNGKTSLDYRWIFEVKELPDGGYNLTNENGLLTADGYVTANGDAAKARLKFVTQNQGDSLVAIYRLSDNLYWNSSFSWIAPYDKINTSSIPEYKFVLETLETNALPLGAVDNDSHYATFSSNEDVVFTSDVEVDAVVVDGSILNITPLTKGDYIVKTTNNVCDVVFNGYYVPANNGVLVKSANDRVSYYYPYKKDETIKLPDNQLKAAPAEGDVFTAEKDYLYYKLAYNNYDDKKGLGFYWGAAGGGAFSVKAGTAYLAVPTPSGSAAKGFSFSGATTGIDATNGVEAEKVREIYTIAGQKVSKMSKPGLYVVNGKKTVIRK
ncbi:MAG: hypothetical protein ACI3YO_00635, partial [Prevotella sp.]